MRFKYLLFLLVLPLVWNVTSLYAQASDAEPSPDEFVEVDKEPVALTPIESRVHYPEAARRGALEGRVTLEALINKDGSVSKVQVLKSDYKVFEQPAIDAMMATHFTPAMNNGQPVRVWLSQTINFKLTNPEPETPQNPFVGLMHMGADSIRMLAASIGPIKEDVKNGIRTITAATEDSLSHDDAPAYITASIGAQGPTLLVLGFRHVSEEDFKNFRDIAFGRAIRASVHAEMEDMFMDISIENGTRSYEIKLKSK